MPEQVILSVINNHPIVIPLSEIEADLYLRNPREEFLPLFSHYFSFDSHALLMTFECRCHMRKLSTVRHVPSSQCSYHVTDHVLWDSLFYGFGVLILDLCKPSIAVIEWHLMLCTTHVT